MALEGNNITETLDDLFAKDEIAQWFPNQSAAFRRIDSASPKNINAKGGQYLVETETPQAIVAGDFAGTDGAEFPTGGRLSFIIMTVLPITHRASFEVTSNVDAQNEAALKQRPAKNYDYVMKGISLLMKAYGLKQSRDLWGNKTGEIARVSGVTGNVVTCNTSANQFGSYLMQAGMDCEFRAADGTLRGYGVVQSMNRKAKTFACKAATVRNAAGAITGTLQSNGVATADRVYMKGCYNNNWTGISAFTEPLGAFQGRSDRSEHYRLPGMKEDKGGATLTVGMMRKMISDQEMRLDGGEATGEFWGSTQIDAYEATGLPTQAYGQSGSSLKQGYNKKGMMFADKKFNRDLYIPRDVLALIDMSEIDKFEMQTFKPLKNGADGTYFHLANGVNAHRDSRFVYFRGIGNLGVEDPSSLGVWYENLSTAGLSTGNN